MERIASFSVDHTKLEPGVYVSRSDADEKTGCVTTTFDLRMTGAEPRAGDGHRRRARD